jgi:RNA polymerase sigma-70 factor (ECF subfamily)
MPRSVSDQERLYSEVVAEYGGAVERLARGYERDADRRRDLLQEIHVALWRSLARFDGRCSMRTWVYRVAHNVATSRVIRARERTPTFVDAVTLESIPDSSDGEAQLDRERTLDRVYALIRQLRPIDRHHAPLPRGR